MKAVIPTINVKTLDEVNQRIELIETFKDCVWAQIDVSDGVFTSVTSFNDPKALRDIDTRLSLEIHLMTWEPEHNIVEWIKSGAKRIIFHYEATHRRGYLINELRKAGIEAGMALRPVTPWTFAEAFLGALDMIQILGVEPGLSGQIFKGEEILNKVKTLKEAHPNVIIEVDGGVNNETLPGIKQAGADIVAVGSYVFDDPDPCATFQALQSSF